MEIKMYSYQILRIHDSYKVCEHNLKLFIFPLFYNLNIHNKNVLETSYVFKSNIKVVDATYVKETNYLTT